MSQTVSAEIVLLERRLKRAVVPLSRVFEAADIDRSTWSRWRSDEVSPTLLKWRAVLRAVDDLAGPPNAPNTQSPDDTGDHALASSDDPTFEIPQSPTAADVPADADLRRRNASDFPA